jgi:hypothetical protein
VGVADSRLMGQHRDHPVAVTHRHRFDVQSRLLPRIRLARIAFQSDRAGFEGRHDQRHSLGIQYPADHVSQQNSRGGIRPALGDTDHRAVVAADPHQIIGERKVGEQLPFADHRMQVVDGAARQDGVFGEQVTESGHRRLPPRGRGEPMAS